MDLRYYYGRFDGAEWHVHPMAYAGTRLYAGEDDYSGLVALDPADPNLAYISTNADPATGDPLISLGDGQRHYEIFRGQTQDYGATWLWTAITSNSTVDNLRPTVPAWPGHTALLWLRGRYRNMLHFSQDIVGVIDP